MWSYGFTNYKSFNSKSNAVTPIPNWSIADRHTGVPVSTKPPLYEFDRGALDFKKWRKIGKELLVKSNISHWLVCKPDGGSLVEWKAGNLNCQNIKNIGSKCPGAKPSALAIYDDGPAFNGADNFYIFSASVIEYTPIHDPCGSAQNGNHLLGVKNPGGNIFIR